MDIANTTNFTCTLANSIPLTSAFFWTASEKFSTLIILPLITFVGDVGNLAFLFTTIRVPQMRTTANLYLGTLAVSDIIFLSGTCVQYVYGHYLSPQFRNYSNRSSLSCWLGHLPYLSCYYYSIEIVFLLSLERYYAICHPVRHRSFTSTSRTIKLLCLSLLIAVILGVLSTIKWGDFRVITFCAKYLEGDFSDAFLLSLYTCELSRRAFATLLGDILGILGFLIAMIGTSIMYYKVIKKLLQRSQINLHSNHSSTDKVHKQVAVILIANGVIFFLCQTPYRLHSIHEILADTLKVWSLPTNEHVSLQIIGRLFIFINSAVNPYIYTTGSSFYRNAFLEAFGVRKKSRMTNNSSNNSIESTASKF